MKVLSVEMNLVERLLFALAFATAMLVGAAITTYALELNDTPPLPDRKPQITLPGQSFVCATRFHCYIEPLLRGPSLAI